MFTGIIQSVGRLAARSLGNNGARLVVACPFPGLVPGESVAVDGVCLTVLEATGPGFSADASAETLARTTLGRLPPGARVNLERALAVGDRLGGHIVAGHVDGVGEVVRREAVGAALRMEVRAPSELLRFVAEKGSLAVDGVSLTVNRVATTSFDVMLVPFTRSATALDDRGVGAGVNLEADVIARYVARALEAREGAAGGAGGISLELLARHGFTGG